MVPKVANCKPHVGQEACCLMALFRNPRTRFCRGTTYLSRYRQHTDNDVLVLNCHTLFSSLLSDDAPTCSAPRPRQRACSAPALSSGRRPALRPPSPPSSRSAAPGPPATTAYQPRTWGSSSPGSHPPRRMSCLPPPCTGMPQRLHRRGDTPPPRRTQWSRSQRRSRSPSQSLHWRLAASTR